jgi:hypothetical protein
MNAQNEREGHRERLAAGAISGPVDLEPQFGIGPRDREFLEARLTPLQKGQDYHKNREITREPFCEFCAFVAIFRFCSGVKVNPGKTARNDGV